ncbi:MAG TPA: glycerate kinase, partial [Candidatus Udaeobacter sp.]
MKILIAPDKFKGTLTAREVAENIAKGLHEARPDAHIEIVPMADGGEGTAEVICNARDCSWSHCKAHDPLGREIDARYAWIGDEKLAVMEMSEAAGMKRLAANELNPDLATTYGVGEMILDAASRGASEVIIGLGGSATNDGGFGMARELGFRFFSDANELIGDLSRLRDLTKIKAPVAAGVSPANARTQPARLPPQLRIIVAADVRNPLLGENGATR